jgi:hypothetical protein
MEAFYAQAAPPKQLVWVEAGDHFFAGALDRLEMELERLLQPQRDERVG